MGRPHVHVHTQGFVRDFEFPFFLPCGGWHIPVFITFRSGFRYGQVGIQVCATLMSRASWGECFLEIALEEGMLMEACKYLCTYTFCLGATHENCAGGERSCNRSTVLGRPVHSTPRHPRKNNSCVGGGPWVWCQEISSVKVGDGLWPCFLEKSEERRYCSRQASVRVELRAGGRLWTNKANICYYYSSEPPRASLIMVYEEYVA